MILPKHPTAKKPVIVGESNPYGSNPAFALWPEPRGASGDRLCRVVMGLSRDTYLDRFERVNLFPSAWGTAAEARERALALVREWAGHTLILLGQKVRRAFDAAITAAGTFGIAYDFVYLPHPSGLNPAWNDPTMVRQCRSVLREKCGYLIPFGEVAS